MPLFAFGLSELSSLVGLITGVITLLYQFGIIKGPPGPEPGPAGGGSRGIPGWVVIVVMIGGMTLFCGGCMVSVFKTKPDPGPGPGPGPGHGPGPSPTPPDKFAGRKVPVNRPIETWDDRLVITLEAVEFRTNDRMRWHLAVANKTGREVTVPINPGESALLDPAGTKFEGVEHSAGSRTGVGVAAGETKPYWIDFKAPPTTATQLVATFPVVAGGHNLSSFGLELVPGPDGPGVSPDSLVRRVVIGKPLASWNPQIACTLESVEFRPDGRMRWRFAFRNRTGRETDVYTYPDENTFLTDETGEKYPGVAHVTTSTLSSGLPDEARVPVWVEFRSPPPGATWLTARFGSGLYPDRKLPAVLLHLPPGKAGPMVGLTFAADAGAAVQDETLDLTVGGAAAKLHVTKQQPRAEVTAFVPAGTEVKYAVKATTQVTLNGKEATYSGAGSGSYVVPSDRRLVYVRDTAAGFNNFRALFQEPR